MLVALAVSFSANVCGQEVLAKFETKWDNETEPEGTYMTGVAVTYAAGLIRAIECAKLVPDAKMPTSAGMWSGTQFVQLFEHRRRSGRACRSSSRPPRTTSSDH